MNIKDIYDDHLRVIGKGNKERVVFFAEGCREALDDYLAERSKMTDIKDKEALFISQKNGRFGSRGIQQMLDTVSCQLNISIPFLRILDEMILKTEEPELKEYIDERYRKPWIKRMKELPFD